MPTIQGRYYRRYDGVRKYRRKVRMLLIEAFGGKCAICGYGKCPRALDHHHVNPGAKSFALGSGTCQCWAKIVNEARKCVLLCCRCHREVEDGITEIPPDAPRFNEDYANAIVPIKAKRDKCPKCGKLKHYQRKFCSRSCSGKNRAKVNWDVIDLPSLLEECGWNIERVGRKLAVTGNAVRKRIRKLEEETA